MNKMILTAGPSITQLEIDYVMDAVRNGVDEHWGDYIKEFERSFAEYIGVRHALSTSSCTGALHLALVALGVGKGDEVIVPDMSWVATASAVCYTGAKPVFADVLPYTWCIDPQDVKDKITRKTKAIIPVHLYGHPARMDELMEIAEEYGLKVVEDAAPAIGAMYKRKRTGAWGHCAAFSFQGAKTLSTGEGGMFVTDDTNLYERVRHLWDHGRAGSGFEILDVGYKYKMSNLQAALGLAQLQRVDELVAKKRQTYFAYCKELDGVDGLLLNEPPSETEKPAYWMTSIVLEKDFRVCRDVLMARLKERGVDSRPFFPQISSFRMFKRQNNYVAEYLGENGVNLPSGYRLTQKDIEYVSDCVKDILGV